MLRASLWHATPVQMTCASVLGPPSERSRWDRHVQVVVGSFSGALDLHWWRVGVQPTIGFQMQNGKVYAIDSVAR